MSRQIEVAIHIKEGFCAWKPEKFAWKDELIDPDFEIVTVTLPDDLGPDDWFEVAQGVTVLGFALGIPEGVM